MGIKEEKMCHGCWEKYTNWDEHIKTEKHLKYLQSKRFVEFNAYIDDLNKELQSAEEEEEEKEPSPPNLFVFPKYGGQMDEMQHHFDGIGMSLSSSTPETDKISTDLNKQSTTMKRKRTRVSKKEKESSPQPRSKRKRTRKQLNEQMPLSSTIQTSNLNKQSQIIQKRRTRVSQPIISNKVKKEPSPPISLRKSKRLIKLKQSNEIVRAKQMPAIDEMVVVQLDSILHDENKECQMKSPIKKRRKTRVTRAKRKNSLAFLNVKEKTPEVWIPLVPQKEPSPEEKHKKILAERREAKRSGKLRVNSLSCFK